MSDIVKQLRGTGGCRPGCQCLLCEAADEIERLTAEVVEKDKRIESLEQALDKASLRTQELERELSFAEDELYYPDKYGCVVITTEQLASGEVVLLTQGQIDNAWKVATGEEPYADDCLAELHIVACEECGGGVSKAWDNGCPSCHGHGWIITSVDVDKYGRIGTGEE